MSKIFLKNKKISTNSGNAMLVSVLFFVFISIAILLGLVSPTLRSFKDTRNLIYSKSSIFLAHSGLEDYYYRLTTSKPITQSADCTADIGDTICIKINLNQSVVRTSVDARFSDLRDLTAYAETASVDRNVNMVLNGGIIPGINFENGGTSVGSGGVTISNAHLSGVYTNGTIVGNGSGTSTVVEAHSAGPSGSISNIGFSDKIYAHTISNSNGLPKGKAYYTVLNSTTAYQYFPGSPYPELMPDFPIDSTVIDAIKTDALAGGEIGTAPCDHILSGGAIGPAKINCNLILNAGNYTLSGPLWVTGDITLNAGAAFNNNAVDENIPIIADDPSNRTTSSKIFWNTAEQFMWAPNNHGPIFISMNNSARSGGAEKAIIYTANHPNGDEEIYLYAPDGLISFENGVFADGVLSAGYKLNVQDNSSIGFGSVDVPLQLNIPSDSYSGSWAIGSWGEVQ